MKKLDIILGIALFIALVLIIIVIIIYFNTKNKKVKVIKRRLLLKNLNEQIVHH